MTEQEITELKAQAFDILVNNCVEVINNEVRVYSIIFRSCFSETDIIKEAMKNVRVRKSI